MKQTKNKSPKMTKKQPINVQLSKADLAELLMVVKDFIVGEIGPRLLDANHRVEMLQRRITDLTKIQVDEKAKRVLICSHKDRFESVWYSNITKHVLGLKYKCVWCGREWIQNAILLSWREKRALRKLGVKI